MSVLKHAVSRLCDLAIGIPLFLGTGLAILLGAAGWVCFMIEPLLLLLFAGAGEPQDPEHVTGLAVASWLVWLFLAPWIARRVMRRLERPEGPSAQLLVAISGLLLGLHPLLMSQLP